MFKATESNQYRAFIRPSNVSLHVCISLRRPFDSAGVPPKPMEEVREGEGEGEGEVEEECEEEAGAEVEYDDDFDEDVEDMVESSSSDSEKEETVTGARGESVGPATPPLPVRADCTPQQLSLVEIMQAIDAENRKVGGAKVPVETVTSEPQLEPRSGVASLSSASLGLQQRGMVDFSVVQRREAKEKAVELTKKRGQVMVTPLLIS